MHQIFVNELFPKHQEKIKNHLTKSKSKTLLVVGYDEMLWEIEPYFQDIMIIDTDIQKLQVAEKIAETKKLTPKIKIQNSTIEAIDRRVDVILYTHSPVPFNIKEILYPGGLLILRTSPKTTIEELSINNNLDNIIAEYKDKEAYELLSLMSH